MEIIKFGVGDVLVMKKKHPCSSDRFSVLRTGSDVKIKCEVCGREVTLNRLSLEKNIKRVIAKEGENK